jgi:hypothetical protein
MRSAATSQFGNRFGMSARRIPAKSCIFLLPSAVSDPMTARDRIRGVTIKPPLDVHVTRF